MSFGFAPSTTGPDFNYRSVCMFRPTEVRWDNKMKNCIFSHSFHLVYRPMYSWGNYVLSFIKANFKDLDPNMDTWVVTSKLAVPNAVNSWYTSHNTIKIICQMHVLIPRVGTASTSSIDIILFIEIILTLNCKSNKQKKCYRKSSKK